MCRLRGFFKMDNIRVSRESEDWIFRFCFPPDLFRPSGAPIFDLDRTELLSSCHVLSVSNSLGHAVVSSLSS